MSIPTMPKVASGYGPDHRVNIVKKVKVDGAWNFYPAVVESNGKLKDKVRIKGTVEVHPEGVYSNRETPGFAGVAVGV